MARLAYFVTPHGYGHAARACAVIQAIHTRDLSIEFDIFTLVPEWFFRDSLAFTFHYHSFPVDIGLVQNGPTQEDLPATLKRLEGFIPFDPRITAPLAEELRAIKCSLVLCDIAPLGIAAAHQAGLPAVLIENFTWDWIYAGYLSDWPQIGRYIEYLQGVFEQSDYRIQVEPVCLHHPDAWLTTPPVSRYPRTPRPITRDRLGIPADVPAVLITMGGIPTGHPAVEALNRLEKIYFVIPNDVPKPQTLGNCILLPHHSQFFHPDLVNACDAVVGKTGYSTLAEVFSAGIPFGFVPRPSFRESAVMEKFIGEKMPGIEIDPAAYQSGAWVDHVPDLLSLARSQPGVPNGAGSIAQKVHSLFKE